MKKESKIYIISIRVFCFKNALIFYTCHFKLSIIYNKTEI